MKAIIITLTLLFTVLTISCTKHPDSNANSNTSAVPTASLEVRPEIKSFLNVHKELGAPAKSYPVTDWARGTKQRIILDDKRDLTFYIESGAVVTVYEEARDGRKTIWGDPIKN